MAIESAASGAKSSTAPTFRRGMLPSWAASVWFHLLLLAAAAFGLRSCTGPGQRGEADADWKTVGLVTRMNESDSREEVERPSDQATEATTNTLDASELPTSALSSDAPPVELPDLPGTEMPDIVGPGAGVPRFPANDSSAASGTVSGGAGALPPAPSGSARGSEGFFGIRDEGQTFVYVIDSSGSMGDPDGKPMAAAKAELMASLESLDREQRFQIIFYSEHPQVMRLPGRAPEPLYWASDINRTLARQFIAVIRPDAGTDHMRALRSALSLEADAIFFLTDADDPALSAKDLDEIRRLNRGRTRIHAVEFGKGARLRQSSALERLASQNDGAFEYRDVTR